MSRVIVIERAARFDMSTAREHGELTYLFEKAPNMFRPENVERESLERLEEIGYHPSRDILCLTGYALTVAIVAAAVTRHYPGPIRVLMFDARERKYHIRILGELSWKETI